MTQRDTSQDAGYVVTKQYIKYYVIFSQNDEHKWLSYQLKSINYDCNKIWSITKNTNTYIITHISARYATVGYQNKYSINKKIIVLNSQ